MSDGRDPKTDPNLDRKLIPNRGVIFLGGGGGGGWGGGGGGQLSGLRVTVIKTKL